MSGVLIAFMLAAGVSAWVYNYFHRQTGGNTKNAAIMAAVAGVFGFIITLLIWNAVS